MNSRSAGMILKFFAVALFCAAGASLAHEETGKASWYGKQFQGKTTASGERFDKDGLTAAHRTLPLGTQAEVTNLETGEKVQVEINDRGPFKPGRVIDLSERAAEEIGIKEK